MQPGVQNNILITQPRNNTIAPYTTLSTPDYVCLFALMCLPTLLFGSVLGKKAYRKHRDKRLKQQILKLERSWSASYQSKQDS
jgi:hypothetical protein